MKSSLPRSSWFALLAIGLSLGCAKAPAKLGEACTSEDGCEGTATCVAGTCFHLCKTDDECLSGRCQTLTNADLQEKIHACVDVDAGAQSTSSSGSLSNGGTTGDVCYDAPICSSSQRVRSCTTSARSCYYLVGTTRYDCAPSCDCAAAAQALAGTLCN